MASTTPTSPLPTRRPTVPAVAAPPAQVDVLGIPLASVDYEDTMDWIDSAVAERRRESVCVATVHIVMRSREDPELRDAMLGSSLIVPDGQPLVWAMNSLGER